MKIPALAALPLLVLSACAGAQSVPATGAEIADANAPAATSLAPAADAASGARDAMADDRIMVQTVGKGPDVILIPGLASSPDVWESTVAGVPGYRYHLVHVNGFAGRAPQANATGAFIDPVADAIAAYIRQQKLGKVTLVGHSLGGTLAMRIATRHPDLVGKLMVVDMLPFMGVMVGGPAATVESVTPTAVGLRTTLATATPDVRKKNIETSIGNMVKDPAERAVAITHSLTSDQAMSAQAMYDLLTTDLRPELGKYSGPMEVLWVYPPNAPIPEPLYKQVFEGAFAGAKQAKLKQIPDSWHFIMWDQPAVFQKELKAFLTE